MSRLLPVFLLLCLIVQSSCKVSSPAHRIEVAIPQIDQEASSIWRTINDINFLEQQGYQVHLPDAPLIDELVKKSRAGKFGNQDYAPIFSFLEAGHYKPVDYRAALAKVTEREPLINNLIQRVINQKSAWDWDFKINSTYPVTFTLYGSGGSYNPDEGSITLFTTPDGKFKRYQDPANTIMHEFVHLGVEESIVRRYNLSHPLKEFVVDQIVHLLFENDLPEYRIQNMGTTVLDDLITRHRDIKRLDAILKRAIGTSGE